MGNGGADCPTADIMRSGDAMAEDMAMGGEDDGRRAPSGRRSSKRRRSATKGVSSTEKNTQKNEDSAPSKRARAESPSSHGLKNGSPTAQSSGEMDGGGRDSRLNSPQNSSRSTRASSNRAKFNVTRQTSTNGGPKPGSDDPQSDAIPSSSSSDDDGEKAPSAPTYSWISGGSFNRTSSTTEHSGVEIDFRGCSDDWRPDPASFTVRPGDVVLLNGGEGSPWSTSQDIDVHNKATRETLQIYGDRTSREVSTWMG